VEAFCTAETNLGLRGNTGRDTGISAEASAEASVEAFCTAETNLGLRGSTGRDTGTSVEASGAAVDTGSA